MLSANYDIDTNIFCSVIATIITFNTDIIVTTKTDKKKKNPFKYFCKRENIVPEEEQKHDKN